ncbi:signal recognition particle protein Srp19 [Candidatus Bathyarchaeota archaeon]|nr:signal recognition particle protein Srp19 [Candidatus Bathyarchaeota archaeon]
MRKQEKIILWPAYFDASKTRREGRRIPKNLAITSPKVYEISQALKKLGFKHEIVADAAYPKAPWFRTGMLIIEKTTHKNKLLRKVAQQLLKIRKK